MLIGIGAGIKIKEKPFPIYLPNAHRSGHMLCAATTRCGKTRLAEWMMEQDRAISEMEEALVVHSLCHEDGLNQGEIALLLNRHKSWVCQRLALIERLSDEAQQSIRLGLLPACLGTELA